MSMISVAHLTFAYEGGLENIFEDVSFRIDTDWKLGFTGRNGRGKTTFLNLLLGCCEYEGTISSSVDFEYFPYDVPDEGIETLELIRTVAPGAEEWEIAREISLLDVMNNALRRPFRTLSNGERTKALLARSLCEQAHLYIWDEPLNYIDVISRIQITKLLLEYKPTLLFVEHDRVFCDEVATKIVRL